MIAAVMPWTVSWKNTFPCPSDETRAWLDLRGNKQLKIAEPVQNEREVSLAMTAVLWPKAEPKGDSVKTVVIASASAAIFIIFMMIDWLHSIDL